MSLTWGGGRLSPEESTRSFNELETAVQKKGLTSAPMTSERTALQATPDLHLYCSECQQFLKLSEDLKRKVLYSDATIELPSHHGKEMQIRIGEQIPDQEKLESLGKIYQTVQGIGSACLYLCGKCLKVLEFDTLPAEIPQHHDQNMVRIYIPSDR